MGVEQARKIGSEKCVCRRGGGVEVREGMIGGEVIRTLDADVDIVLGLLGLASVLIGLRERVECAQILDL